MESEKLEEITQCLICRDTFLLGIKLLSAYFKTEYGITTDGWSENEYAIDYTSVMSFSEIEKMIDQIRHFREKICTKNNISKSKDSFIIYHSAQHLFIEHD